MHQTSAGATAGENNAREVYTVKQVLVETFKEWVAGPLTKYAFTDTARPASADRIGLWYAAQNPYIKTDEDIQVKFGGYLEQRLPADLVVHAGLNPYRVYPGMWADLSVHEVSPADAAPASMGETVKAVIEIRYAKHRNPNWLFEKGKIQEDLEKLAGLQEGVDRVMMLLDESLAIEKRYIQQTITYARENNITILSNNPELMYGTA